MITGTDISESAASVPKCIVWDMHHVKPEWLGAIDFIYSNSSDHTYDAQLLFVRWVSCLSENGRPYVTWTIKHSDEGVMDETNVDTKKAIRAPLAWPSHRTSSVQPICATEPLYLLETLFIN